MEAPPEIVDRFDKAESRCETVQGDNVAALGATSMTAEMPVLHAHAQRWMLFVAALVTRATDGRPLAAWLRRKRAAL
jgi:hypothetical protein